VQLLLEFQTFPAIIFKDYFVTGPENQAVALPVLPGAPFVN
jgi:hypothetical protein